MTHPAAQQLELLGYRESDRVNLRLIGDARSRKCTLPTSKVLLLKQPQGVNVYFVVNGGGDSDGDVTHGRAIFIEHDDLPIEDQLIIWQKLGLPPPTFQIMTGNKSVHSYWTFGEPISIEQWKQLQADLLEFAYADRSIKNPSRVMRLAGFAHAKTGKKAELVNVTGARYSFEELRRIVPIQEKQKARAHSSDSSASDRKAEALEALQYMGCFARQPGTGTYEDTRNIAWSLCSIFGVTEAEPIIEQWSPSEGDWDIRKVCQDFDSAGGIGAETFFYYAKQAGWKKHSQKRANSSDKRRSGASSQPTDFNEVEFTTKDEYALRQLFKNGKDYITLRGVVHEWTGSHYEKVDDALLMRRITEWGRPLSFEGKKGKLFHPYQTARATGDVLSFLKTVTAVDPAKVNPPGLNCKNGRVTLSWVNDIPEWKLEPHSPDVHYTYCSDYDYDENADHKHCERLLAMFDLWQRELFLKTASTALDMENARKVLDRDIRALWLWGDGSNGKDALRYILSLVFADQGMTGVTLSDFKSYEMGRKFGVASIEHSRVNWPSENSSFHKIDDIESLKAAINGMPIAIERKGQDIRESNVNACFFFSGNEAPRIEAGSTAIASRFSIIHLNKVFGKGGLDPDPRFLRDRKWVLKNVVAAMLNLLLHSLRSAARDGIDHSKAQNDLQEARKSTSHLYQFMEDVGLAEDPVGKVPVREVWDLLQQWYVDEGYATFTYDSYSEKTQIAWADKEAFRGDKLVKNRATLTKRFSLISASVFAERLPDSKRTTVLRGLALKSRH